MGGQSLNHKMALSGKGGCFYKCLNDTYLGRFM